MADREDPPDPSVDDSLPPTGKDTLGDEHSSATKPSGVDALAGAPTDDVSGDGTASHEAGTTERVPDRSGTGGLESGAGPEQAISKPLVDDRRVTESRRAELRRTYGYVRTFFKSRPDRYRELQRLLKQARSRVTYDKYLTESAHRALISFGLGGIAGLFVVGTMLALGDPSGSVGPLIEGLGTIRMALLSRSVPVAALVFPAIGAISAGVGVWVARTSLYPHRIVSNRRRDIDLNLPYAITFMYALSRGGMNIVDVCRRLASADEIYGEAANEFDVIVREMDLFGNDLLHALANVRTLTPSENFQRFLDDLLGVLESGGDLEAFLQDKAEEYLDEALNEQRSFIETLGTLSELFVVTFVAAPLFLIVVLMVVSFLGADTVGVIALLIYVAFPVGMVGFLLGVAILSRPYTDPSVSLDIEEGRTFTADQVAADARFPAYRRANQRTRLRSVLSDPVSSIRERPVYSLALTAPLGMAVAGFAVVSGTVDPTMAAVLSAPLETTVWLAVGPLLTATVLLTVLHEQRRHHHRFVARRFPDVLATLASANRTGVDFVAGLDLVTKRASDTLAEEFEKVRNDVRWNHDLTQALLSFADRLNVPQLTRTMTLIAEGSRSSGDLHSLLEIAAEDARARAKLEAARRQEVNAYLTIVIVGFLVYLLVLIMIGATYLDPIAELAASAGMPDQPGAIAGVGAVPVETYRLLFLHSALIQGFGSGLIAGKLADNYVLSGLKYGIGLVILTVVAFVLFF